MRSSISIAGTVCAALVALPSVSAIDVDFTSPDSIKSAASTLAHGMMSYYTGNLTGQTLGLLNQPYYWWESGGMWGAMVDYWYYTGDTTYNDQVMQGLLSQIGTNNDYMPTAQQKDEGNDDQAFWGMAAMSAAEYNFPNPPPKSPGWVALAQAVFNSQTIRWDNTTCGGGLRWQIFTFNNGYNYKNSVANGGLFNIAARLGAYTGNQTYFDWAEKVYDWTSTIGLISPQYDIWDGTDDTINCTQFSHLQWTYNAGLFLYGAAVMWNHTQSELWQNRTQNIWESASKVFFTGTNNQIMYEVACEPQSNCDTDQLSFKAYTSRWMAAATRVAPWIYDDVMPFLNTSAKAAAAQCTGAPDGVTCGTKWTTNGVWDGTNGVGQQMSAMEVIQSTLITQLKGPVSNTTGGTSIGNPSAGSNGDADPGIPSSPITTSDKAGAGIITAIILISLLGGTWWMLA